MSVRMASRYGSRILSEMPVPSASQYVCRSCRGSANTLRTFCTSTNTARLSRRTKSNLRVSDSAGLVTSQRRFLASERSQTRTQTAYADDVLVQDISQDPKSSSQQAEVGVREQKDRKHDRKPRPQPETGLQPTQEQYTPAKTWDGLEFIGYREGDWKDLPSTRRMEYEPYVKSRLHSRTCADD